jgi:hypothetical protein
MERVGSGGSRALFPKDSFSLKDFSNKDFIVRDFVDHLAETAVPTNRRSGPAHQAAFDPKPLIRTFESMARPYLFCHAHTQWPTTDHPVQMRYHN